MGNITKSLWGLITNAANEPAPAGADLLALATQPGVMWTTEIRNVTVGDLIGLVPPASVFVDEGLDGDGTIGNPLNVLVDGISIVIDPITNELEVVGGAGAGGNSIYSTAVGSEPTANAGDVDFYSQSAEVARYSGTAWEPWGPLFKFKAPVNGDFAWVNQGAASVATTQGGILLTAPAVGSDQMRARVKAVPTVPYTVRVAFIPQMPDENFFKIGPLWYASGAGTFDHVCIQNGNAAQFARVRWNSATVVANTTQNLRWLYSNIVWMEIWDDNVNRGVRWSVVGSTGTFTPWFQVVRTDHLTPTHVGFGVGPNNGTYLSRMLLLSWEEFNTATP